MKKSLIFSLLFVLWLILTVPMGFFLHNYDIAKCSHVGEKEYLDEKCYVLLELPMYNLVTKLIISGFLSVAFVTLLVLFHTLFILLRTLREL